MPDGVDRFTPRARRVLGAAEGEARRLGHAEIDAHHLLLAIADERDDGGNRVLLAMGVPAEVVRWAVERAVPAGDYAGDGERPLTQSLKDAVSRAADEARQRGSELIGTEHLLLGLFGDGSSATARVLDELRLTL